MIQFTLNVLYDIFLKIYVQFCSSQIINTKTVFHSLDTSLLCTVIGV